MESPSSSCILLLLSVWRASTPTTPYLQHAVPAARLWQQPSHHVRVQDPPELGGQEAGQGHEAEAAEPVRRERDEGPVEEEGQAVPV